MNGISVPYTKNYQDRAVSTAVNATGIREATVSDHIASAVSQTDQLLERLENALQRLCPTPQKGEGSHAPSASGLVQQANDLATRLQYAVKLTEEVCAAVGV